MDRAALLLAVAKAASAAALGQDDLAVQRKLDAKKFELRIRFGCEGRVTSKSPQSFGVRFEPDTKTLRLRAAPNLTLDDSWITELAGETIEAAEGFLLERPWLLTAGCSRPTNTVPEQEDLPLNETNPDAVAPKGSPDQFSAQTRTQRVGIAQFFTEEDPRTSRRDQRAYEVTKVLKDDERPSAQGYDLVLSGRLRRLHGRVISCRVERADLPPDCLIAVEFGPVWIEAPATNEVLAEWAR
jgi:hypothetical protein